MKRVEEIKTRRQAQFIYDRQKKARAIERKKDVKEVQRDIALIKSPAVGMKRAAKDMDVDGDEDLEDDINGIWSASQLAAKEKNIITQNSTTPKSSQVS